MPTYEYECNACHHKFEKFQSITAAPTRKCPECGKSKVRRLIGAGGGIIFRGSGFYQTDYRSDSYKTAASADKSSSSPSSTEATSTASSGTESKKSEAKSDSGEKKPSKKAGSKAAG